MSDNIITYGTADMTDPSISWIKICENPNLPEDVIDKLVYTCGIYLE